MDKVKAAEFLFERGYSCAQAILASYGPDLGLGRVEALRLASGLGGGMGHTGRTCGTVSAALLVLGLRHGAAEAAPRGTRGLATEKAGEFIRRFEATHDTSECKTLLGADLSTPEGMQEAVD